MTETTVVSPALGQPGDVCRSCGAPLAVDQRYCLSCGTRRAEARVPFFDVLGDLHGAAAAVAAPMPPASPPPLWSRGGPWAVAALVVGTLGLGVLIGRGGEEDQAPVAQRAPVVNVQGPAAALAASTAAATPAVVTDEWPAGKDGWTIKLRTVAKTAPQSELDAARTAVAGAGSVQVLDGDAHGLDAGQWVLFSGVYDTKKAATSALKGVQASVAEARVVEVKASGESATETSSPDDASSSSSSSEGAAAVDTQELQEQQNASPEEFQKRSKKLPKTTELPGEPPAKDGGTPGGGTEAESIG